MLVVGNVVSAGVGFVDGDGPGGGLGANDGLCLGIDVIDTRVGLGGGIADGVAVGHFVVGTSVGLGGGIDVGSIVSWVGLGEGINEGLGGTWLGLGEGINRGLVLGIDVVGRSVGLGVGSTDGFGLGVGLGIFDGLGLGDGLGASVSGPTIFVNVIENGAGGFSTPVGYTTNVEVVKGDVSIHSSVVSS